MLANKLFGVNKIIAIDVADDKLSNAKLYGATNLINASKENVREKLFSLTNGKGVDAVFESVGGNHCFNLSLKLLKVKFKLLHIFLNI